VSGSSAGEQAGLDTSGAGPTATERLWPSVSVWAAVIVLAGFIGMISMPFGTTAGLLTAAAALIAMIVLLIVWTPVVGVRAGELVAGRAHVPLALVGEVTVLEKESFRRAHGRELDARAFLCVRGWIPTGVRIQLTDPEDPTPYWLVSARRPQRLQQAVADAREAG
jgi:hypothetical protein